MREIVTVGEILAVRVFPWSNTKHAS